jgi:hypothetical protein
VGIVSASTAALAIPATHAHVSSYPHAHSLVRQVAAQGRTLCEAGELLGTIDCEGFRLYLHPEGEVRRGLWIAIFDVEIGRLLCFLIESEGQFVSTFVTH